MPAFRLTAGGAVLIVRVTPNAGADRVDGVERRDDGSEVLRLRVRAAPENGRANAAAIRLVAGAVGLSRTAVTLVAGAASRQKTLQLSGDPASLALRLQQWQAPC